MLIGVPKEIKNHEYRVGMTPLSVREAVRVFQRNVDDIPEGPVVGGPKRFLSIALLGAADAVRAFELSVAAGEVRAR